MPHPPVASLIRARRAARPTACTCPRADARPAPAAGARRAGLAAALLGATATAFATGLAGGLGAAAARAVAHAAAHAAARLVAAGGWAG